MAVEEKGEQGASVEGPAVKLVEGLGIPILLKEDEDLKTTPEGVAMADSVANGLMGRGKGLVGRGLDRP